MPPAYRFLDRWVVSAPIERVYDTIGDVLGYARWWTDFVIRATGDEAPPEAGKKNELLVKAYLPYKVNFALEVIEVERPRRIVSRPRRTSTARASGRSRRGTARRWRRSTGDRASTSRSSAA